VKNVYEGIPANGTVMGKLTEQELKGLKQLCIDYEIRMTGTPHFQQYEDFEKYGSLSVKWRAEGRKSGCQSIRDLISHGHGS
jgi:hypothetical protein